MGEGYIKTIHLKLHTARKKKYPELYFRFMNELKFARYKSLSFISII